MKCIFCEKDSDQSRSVEHIIPESFGNSTAILPKGVVCDTCNNYIGREIEAPFLNSQAVLLLRQELSLKNKHQKLIQRFDYPTLDESVQQVSARHYFVFSKENKTEEEIIEAVARYQKYVNDTDAELLIPSVHVSRMLAKMALEAFIHRCGVDSGVCDYIREDAAFKPLRKYVRYDARKMWEYSVRRIYPRSEAYEGNPHESINWEYMFLYLPNGEVYFVIAMFGMEYAINMGGSSLDGYKEWLSENENISPLYMSEEQYENNRKGYAKTMYSSSEE